MQPPDLHGLLHAVAIRRLVNAAAARPDWPSALIGSRQPPQAFTVPASETMAAHAVRFALPLSRRGKRRARGKAKGADHG